MKSLLERFGFRVGKGTAETTAQPELHQLGVYGTKGNLLLCPPFSLRRGVKLVYMTDAQLRRFEAAANAWTAMQEELEALPKSLRPRKRRSSVTPGVDEGRMK